MIRVLITEIAPGLAEGIRAALATVDDVHVTGYARDGLEAVQMAVTTRPEILLLHDHLPGLSGPSACELISLVAPGVACALLCDDSSEQTLRRAMRAGARAVITPATSPQQLAQIIADLKTLPARRRDPEYRMALDPDAMPQTIALLSPRDGAGKSTLAANLGAALLSHAPDKVVLVDLSGQFGSLALLLNSKPAGNVLDLAGYAMEMDLDLVETFLFSHPSGLKLLAGAARPDPAWMDILSVNFIAALLGILRRRYRYIICDLPATVWPGSLYAASRAQLALCVGSLWSITELNALAEMIDAFVPHFVTDESFRLVLNRAANQDAFDEAALRKATRKKIWHSVPNDSQTVHAAANDGVPAVLAKPSSPFSRSITQLADKIVEEARARVPAPEETGA
ncbi:MAG: response regulator [Armatimonadetes bacterium]|nr:response regulator [Armatimonadota bacterium]